MSTLTVEHVFRTHAAVWDMPTLAADHTDVIDWLMTRYEAHFDSASQVVILDKATGTATRHQTNDVRMALYDTLLKEVHAS
jgi:hypothetical protein